jgi:hypothetical protein
LTVFIGIPAAMLLALSAPAQDFKSVREGFEYAELAREIDGLPVRMNLLRLDLSKIRLDVVHAMDAAIGVEKTSSLATRHGAFAAINAGFFRLDTSIFNGDDVGTLVIDGTLLSESHNDRTTLSMVNGPEATEVGFSRARKSACFSTGKKMTEANGINRERKAGEIVLYTPFFGRSTLTSPDGLELVVQEGRIEKIADRKGSSLIPAEGFVISVTGQRRGEFLEAAKVGEPASLGTRTNETESINGPNRGDEDCVAGVPRLVRDGHVDVTWQEEKASQSFAETKHPRTAVALLKDGKFLMVTVDGRSSASSGMTLQKLAELLVELGACDAMNLDGGGSTTMFLDGKVVNQPSDNEGERRISSAIIVTPR